MGRILVTAGVVLVTFASCARGPGTLSGELAGKPYEVRMARLTGGLHQLSFDVQDQLTQCDSKLKSGRIVRLVLQATTDIPAPGVYALTDAGLPGVSVVRVITNDTCGEINVKPPVDAFVELVDVSVDPRLNLFEADLRLRLTFEGDEVLEGSVHGSTCHATAALYCDAN